MSEKTIAKYAVLSRPFIFIFVLFLHIGAIYIFNFKQKADSVETVDFREADVFKLVDIQEYTKPAPLPVAKVSNQPKASENIVETKDEVEAEEDLTEYLPQHKISSVPVIPGKEVLSRIVYPPMALKQGIEAVVYLELFIDSKGVIKNIKVLKDPGHGFAQAAVSALQGITCIPANTNGKSCAVRYRYPVKFTLN